MSVSIDLRIAGAIQGILSVFFVIICQIMLQIFTGDFAWKVIHYLIPLSPLLSMIIMLVFLKPRLEQNQINNIRRVIDSKFKPLHESIKEKEEYIMSIKEGASGDILTKCQEMQLEILEDRDRLQKLEAKEIKIQLGIRD